MNEITYDMRPYWTSGDDQPATLIQLTIRGIITVMNRLPLNADNDNDQYAAFVERQTKADRNYDNLKDYNSIPTGCTAAVQ